MLCSSCGKSIPYNGKVCPWCHADKSKDRQEYAIAMIVAILGIGIGYLAAGMCGCIAGGIICGAVGAIVGPIVAVISRRK